MEKKKSHLIVNGQLHCADINRRPVSLTFFACATFFLLAFFSFLSMLKVKGGVAGGFFAEIFRGEGGGPDSLSLKVPKTMTRAPRGYTAKINQPGCSSLVSQL